MTLLSSYDLELGKVAQIRMCHPTSIDVSDVDVSPLDQPHNTYPMHCGSAREVC
jgi:hypothetical protein